MKNVMVKAADPRGEEMATNEFELASMLKSHLAGGTRRLEIHCDLDRPSDATDIVAILALQELYRVNVIEYSGIVVRDVLRALGMGTWKASTPETWVDLRIELRFGTCTDDSMVQIHRFAREMAPYLSNVKVTHPNGAPLGSV